MDSPLINHLLRIVTIRSLVTLYVKSNAEKVNYQSDPGSLTVFVSLFFIENNNCLRETSLQFNSFYG